MAKADEKRRVEGTGFAGLTWRGVYGVPWKAFLKDLIGEIREDNVPNGAAALAYYLMLAVFPAMIFLLSLLPYLPIHNLQQSIMGWLSATMPGDAASLFSNTVNEIVRQPRGGLLSFGALFTLWAASAGMVAIMQELNITYDVKEGRPFWKTRGTAILLTLFFGVLLITAFALIILGGDFQNWLTARLNWGPVLVAAFTFSRWLIIVAALLLAFAMTYYFGPDVEQKFKFITPGSVLATSLLALASLGFRVYAENFGKYSVTYGSLGAVIVFMAWLNIMGLVILLGSEINALIEHYSPEGKNKGEKQETDQAA